MKKPSVEVVPGQEAAEDALSNIAGQGILGSLCVILIVALVFTIRALLKEKDRRFEDRKTVLDIVEKHNVAAKELAIEATKAQAELDNSLRNQKDALSAVQTTLASHTMTVNNLSNEVSRLQGRKEAG